MNNKLINDDCIKVMQRIPDGSIDLIVTDPPYLISYKSRSKNKESRFIHEIHGDKNNDDNKNLISEFFKEAYRVLNNNSAAYVFCSDKTVDFFRNKAEVAGFKIKNSIVWVKNNHGAGDTIAAFGRKYEIILLLNKGRAPINGKRLSDVWEFPRVSSKNQIHQNQKPLNLIKQCIEKHSKIDDVILDPFAGSATTAIAAMDLQRKYICCEIDSYYYEVADKRIKDYLGE